MPERMCLVEKVTPPISEGAAVLNHICTKDVGHEGPHKCHDACDYTWESHIGEGI